jgi:hypothetical protein
MPLPHSEASTAASGLTNGVDQFPSPTSVFLGDFRVAFTVNFNSSAFFPWSFDTRPALQINGQRNNPGPQVAIYFLSSAANSPSFAPRSSGSKHP